MASPDVVAPALLLFIPLVSLTLFSYNWLVHKSTPTKGAVLLLLAILAAVSGGTALSVACGEPLRIVAKVFANLLHATLSGVSIYALTPSCHALAFPPLFLNFTLSLAGLLIACELISALIPASPLLLPAMLALVSRIILLTLATATATLLRRRRLAGSADVNMEKGRPAYESSDETSGRVSSPTQDTWPFPGSLASQDQPRHVDRPANKLILPDLSSSVFTRTPNVNEYAYKNDRNFIIFLPLVVTIAQIFATLSAALKVAAGLLGDNMTSQINQSQMRILLASTVCLLLWSFLILATIQSKSNSVPLELKRSRRAAWQVLPVTPPPCSSEKHPVTGYEQRPFGRDSAKFSRDNPMTRTPKPLLSRRESDSLLDFLSLRDPFASSPPPPPPLPPAGLGLDEIDVGWNGSQEIGMQYRFPAPRSIVKGGRRKGKNVNGKNRLVHQGSARALLPVPETRGTEVDVGGDREFGAEARLAQLLLQSLSGDGEDGGNLNVPAPAPIVQPPQVAHVPQTSRWSTSTTVPSIVSASISNRSGVSTYATCASERVPTSRFSMNTITSALGSRKSSEAKRKSVSVSTSKG